MHDHVYLESYLRRQPVLWVSSFEARTSLLNLVERGHSRSTDEPKCTDLRQATCISSVVAATGAGAIVPFDGGPTTTLVEPYVRSWIGDGRWPAISSEI